MIPPKDDLAHANIALADPVANDNPYVVLLGKMIERDLDPKQVGEMLGVAERYSTIMSQKAYNQAMTAAQGEMPAIIRDSENTHTKKRYASWEGLNQLIKPVYSRHGFSLSFTEEPSKSTAEGLWMICHCRHAQGHTEIVQGIFPRDGTGAKGGSSAMNAIQAVGSTRSYAKRYLAKDLFCLAESDEDNDGQTTQTDPRLLQDQIRQVNEGLDECRELGLVVELEPFLKYLNIESLEAMTPAIFATAMWAINVKRKKAAKAGGAA